MHQIGNPVIKEGSKHACQSRTISRSCYFRFLGLSRTSLRHQHGNGNSSHHWLCISPFVCDLLPLSPLTKRSRLKTYPSRLTTLKERSLQFLRKEFLLRFEQSQYFPLYQTVQKKLLFYSLQQ